MKGKNVGRKRAEQHERRGETESVQSLIISQECNLLCPWFLNEVKTICYCLEVRAGYFDESLPKNINRTTSQHFIQHDEFSVADVKLSQLSLQLSLTVKLDHCRYMKRGSYRFK